MPEPTTLAGIGSIIGGVGALASGARGFFDDGGLKGKDLKQSIKIQNKYGMKHRLKWARKYARKYKFHPLTALGVNPGSDGGSFAQPASEPDFARMGQGLERAIAGAQHFTPQAKEAARIQLEQEKQRLQNMRLQNHGLLKQIQDLDSPTGPPASGITEEQIPLQHPAYASGNQEGRAVKGLYQIYRHPDNTLLRIPAEDAADFLSESMIDSAILQTKRWWSNLTRGFRARMSEGSLRKIRDELDSMENFMRQNRELRPDEYLQFSPQMGMPIVARDRGGYKKLFRETNSIFKRNRGRYGGMRFRRNYQ